MSQHEEQQQARRVEVRAMAKQMGVAINRLPSGLYHLSSKSVDIKVLDLANVHRADLNYRA